MWKGWSEEVLSKKIPLKRMRVLPRWEELSRVRILSTLRSIRGRCFLSLQSTQSDSKRWCCKRSSNRETLLLIDLRSIIKCSSSHRLDRISIWDKAAESDPTLTDQLRRGKSQSLKLGPRVQKWHKCVQYKVIGSNLKDCRDHQQLLQDLLSWLEKSLMMRTITFSTRFISRLKRRPPSPRFSLQQALSLPHQVVPRYQ